MLFNVTEVKFSWIIFSRDFRNRKEKIVTVCGKQKYKRKVSIPFSHPFPSVPSFLLVNLLRPISVFCAARLWRQPVPLDHVMVERPPSFRHPPLNFFVWDRFRTLFFILGPCLCWREIRGEHGKNYVDGGRERFSSKIKKKGKRKERGNKFEMHILLCIE